MSAGERHKRQPTLRTANRKLRAALHAALRIPSMAIYDTDQLTGRTYEDIISKALRSTRGAK